ncbi:thioesterase family protein [Mycolicibacterium vinylchloridicum]|uniref:thioesterase family protein n=1 Tax=Mycolicibacterium vinylchloridicum TaxID=2736928 RepID=UPI0015CA4C58|nr:thioesterase family protein [Mycolicibacterium vinylchloridicum]
MADSYYERIDQNDLFGERFSATEYVRGGWDPTIQNAAPVSALLVRAMERCSPRQDVRLTRVVVDLLGPVPISDELWVIAQLERTGSKIELVSAEMLAPAPGGGFRTVAKAAAWRFARFDTEALTFAADLPLRPVTEAARFEVDGTAAQSYITSLEWRMLTELHDIPAESWARPIVNLVAGEVMTPLERLFTMADMANGLGTRIEMLDWMFMNTDLAVHIHRVPDGDWIGVRAETNYGPDGVGVSVGTLFDQRGAIAKIQQAQLLRPRVAT